MKQTAVDWFFKALIENQDKTYKQIELILEQAKAMEKEQIIEIAMYHRDSCVQKECIESYIKKHYESNT